MQNDVRAELAYQVLSRVLKFFESEIAQSSDEEVLEAAAELRMNPRMKGSIAFAGITFPHGFAQQVFRDLDAEQLAALRRRLGMHDDARDPSADEWPDHANLAGWVALIRQLRGK